MKDFIKFVFATVVGIIIFCVGGFFLSLLIWVLLPSGLLLCAVGALSAGFFRRMDQDAIGS